MVDAGMDAMLNTTRISVLLEREREREGERDGEIEKDLRGEGEGVFFALCWGLLFF